MEPLALKDIHLPPPPAMGWPAPGWWLLAVVLLLLVVGAIGLWRYRRRQRGLRQAQQALMALSRNAANAPQASLAALSQLLKRVALSTAPRQTVAGLSGDAWLAYLDQGFTDAPFSQGVGRCLAAGQYQAQALDGIDWPALIALCQRWIRQQRPPHALTGGREVSAP